jgi:hypothetical protein
MLKDGGIESVSLSLRQLLGIIHSGESTSDRQDDSCSDDGTG